MDLLHNDRRKAGVETGRTRTIAEDNEDQKIINDNEDQKVTNDNEDQKVINDNDDNFIIINAPDSQIKVPLVDSKVVKIDDIKKMKYIQDYLDTYSFSELIGEWTGICSLFLSYYIMINNKTN